MLTLLSKYRRYNIQPLFNITTVLSHSWRNHSLFPHCCNGHLNCLAASILDHLLSVLKVIVLSQTIIHMLSFLCSKSSNSLSLKCKVFAWCSRSSFLYYLSDVLCYNFPHLCSCSYSHNALSPRIFPCVRLRLEHSSSRYVQCLFLCAT